MNTERELITENPFAILVRRINRIEYQNEQILAAIQRKEFPPSATSGSISKKIDFPTMMKEYYPGIPVSTVRQATAHLGRTKVGKRLIFDRDEVERDQEEKRQKSSKGLAQEIEAQFINHHQRRGGRKS